MMLVPILMSYLEFFWARNAENPHSISRSLHHNAAKGHAGGPTTKAPRANIHSWVWPTPEPILFLPHCEAAAPL